LMGALTRIEQHYFPEQKRIDEVDWRGRIHSWISKGPKKKYESFMSNDSYWQAYLDLDYKPKTKQLRSPMPAYDLFGQFIFDYARGEFDIPGIKSQNEEAKFAFRAIHNEFSKLISELVKNRRILKKDDEQTRTENQSITGIEVLDALFLKCGEGNNLSTIQDLFPSLKNAFLLDTPGVKLLSGPSLEMALYDYAPNSHSPKCGVFLVVREARPPEVSTNKIGLVRDLIYIHKPFGPIPMSDEDEPDGSYVSTVDDEIMPIKIIDAGNYIKISGMAGNNDKKNIELYFAQPDIWHEEFEDRNDRHACTVGLLHGITERRQSPGSWKVLISKPENWGDDLTKIRAMLDLCGAKNPELIPREVRKRIVEKLSRTGLQIIGSYPRSNKSNGSDTYTPTRKLFSDYVTFLSEGSRKLRMDTVANALGLSEENPREHINYNDFRESFEQNWFNIESSLFVLNLEGERPIRYLASDDYKNIFGRKRLTLLKKKKE